MGIHTQTPKNFLDVAGGVAIGSTFAGVETVDSDGLWVEGDVKIGGTADVQDATTSFTYVQPLVVSGSSVSSTSTIIAVNNTGAGDAFFSTAIDGTIGWSFGVDRTNGYLNITPDFAFGGSGTRGLTANWPGGGNTDWGFNVGGDTPTNTIDARRLVNPTENTVVRPVIDLGAMIAGATAGVGFGSSMRFRADNGINTYHIMSAISSVWEDATDELERSKIEIDVINNGNQAPLDNILVINKDGLAILNDRTAPRSALHVVGDGYFDGYVVADHLRLPELDDSVETVDDYSSIFVKASDSDLYYKDSAGSEFNLTAGASTTAPLYTITTVQTGSYGANFDEVVRCDPSGGGFTITLPDASTNIGQTIIVKNTTSSTNTITIQGTGGDTIDGLTSVVIEEGYKSITFVSYSASEWGRI